jgi:gliding motility-associated-like protein
MLPHLQRGKAASLCQASHRYALAALDTCGNLSAPALHQAQHSLFLQIRNVDVCKGKLTLDWNPYENFHPFLKQYRILESIDGQAFSLISTLTAPDSLTPPADSLKLQHLTPGKQYCYQVQAVSGGDPPWTSSSCIECIALGEMLMPDFLSIRFASVEGEHILLCFRNDTMASTSHYLLYRADTEQGPFDLIATLPFEKQETLCYEDHTAEVNRQSYYYRLEAVDSCGNPSGVSQLARSILLSATAREDMHNLLQWNPYQGWDSLAHYRVLQQAEQAPFKSIALTAAVEWEDDVSHYADGRGQFNYRIEAVQGPSLPDFRDTARSNTVRVQQESLIFIPNAFTPGGRNPLFRPICSFTAEGEYLLRIFNRWGQEIFSSTNHGQGWDGQYKGSYVPGGTYVYQLRLRNSQGLLLERRGGLSVIY